MTQNSRFICYQCKSDRGNSEMIFIAESLFAIDAVSSLLIQTDKY